jgi:hypothetical protein
MQKTVSRQRPIYIRRPYNGWLPLLLTFATGIAVAQGDAAAYYRHRRGYSYNYSAVRARMQQATAQAASAQLAAAKQVLTAAESTGESAQSKLDAAVAKLKEKSQQFHEAQSTTRHLAKELAEIESDILGEQKDDSPYAKAKLEVEAARRKLKEIEERALSEQSAQLELTGLSGSKFFDKKTSILELNLEYLQAKAALEAAGSELARIRFELFKNDKDWKDAAEALTQARKDEKEAEEKTHAGSLGRMGTLHTIRNANEAAAAARIAIAQAEAVLKAVGGNKYNKPAPSSSPTGSPLPKNKL